MILFSIFSGFISLDFLKSIAIISEGRDEREETCMHECTGHLNVTSKENHQTVMFLGSTREVLELISRIREVSV
jgi:hypothetical protein